MWLLTCTEFEIAFDAVETQLKLVESMVEKAVYVTAANNWNESNDSHHLLTANLKMRALL